MKPENRTPEIAFVKGRVKALRYGPTGDSAPRPRLRRLVWPKGFLRPGKHGPNAPVWGMVRCYRTISNEIQNHWLICIPPFPRKQPSDWRQLEFPATTNGIPRFFRADPDHEGMVKDQQVRRLVKLKKNEKTLTMAAAKAGMSGKLPSQCQPERYWRTRSDPFESVWPEVKEILKRSPTVEAKAVFDHLCRQQEGAFQQGQLRTLQRRIKQWKAEYGEAKEVMFPQKYQPGHQAQSDFTFMGRLGVTIQGQPFPHLLYHFVLAYSNWEATTLCFSESFESLSLGLQNALWELGELPEEHRTDRLSAAVKNLKREEFTERYQALLRHFGMRSSRTQAGKAHENGDVEQSHHRLKRAIEQELLLRCSRDFSSREEYEGFVAVIVSRRNAARQKRLGEELAVMRPLPARRLDDFTRQWVRVSPSSTIRVRHNTYSVDSRLIGERVQVRVWADQVEVYYGGRRQARMPRLRGEGKHRIDYRHVIHSLVRKPGAFTRYRWREDLFPGILFRVAYDELRRDCPATADRQYLKILEVAAQEGEQRVREALQVLTVLNFRVKILRELKKIKLAWPELNYSTAPGVLILLPSVPAITPVAASPRLAQ